MSAVAPGEPVPLEHFESYAEQRSASVLGMWVFLVNELLLFAGLFMTALALRLLHPEAVLAAGEHLKWWLGALNTVVLVTSSLTMTFAIEAARSFERRTAVLCLALTAGLGALFLGIKGLEYYLEYEEHLMPFLDRPFALPDAASRLYMNLYFVATGLHGLHLLIGVGLVLGLALRVSRPGFLEAKPTHVEITGLYWHFIDFIWMLLFATLYLVNR